MLTDQHPITPPPELVQQWWQATMPNIETSVKDQLCTQAARWGADQQLNADCEWLYRRCLISGAEELRAAMRPKPPSLAEQALAQTNAILDDPNRALLVEVRETLELSRRALERLQELEQQENND